jgi:hypothetical protein
MEALYLVCGARWPQLKRHPLGCRQMRLVAHTLITLALSVGSASAQRPELPSVVRAGLLAYQHSGAKLALKTWSQDSPIANQFGAQAERAFEQIEGAYGNMIGYDVLDVVSLGPHVTRSYVVILYDSGPTYMSFDCYKKADHWVLTAFLFNAKPDLILPPAMFAH